MYLKELAPLTENKTSMKVKMFIRHTLDDIENEVNDWLENQTFRIYHITQSQCEKQGKFVFVMSVFYETIKGE